MNFRFQPLNEQSHLTLLHSWLNEPHVVERWHSAAPLEEIREDFFGSGQGEGTERFAVCLDDKPIGYIQFYWTMQSEDGWWEEERAPGTVGIDFFIGPSTQIGRGIGTEMIRHFLRLLFENATIERVISDPAPDNPRSIRCLEKTGFSAVAQIVTPDGPATLMECRRVPQLPPLPN